MNFFSFLGGTGTVGNVTTTLGHVAPGNSVGKITTGDLTINNGSSSLDVQINGTAPGVGYDQIIANGSVNLTNPTLNISMNFPGAVGNQYVLIANDGSDPVDGTFLKLPEGTNFTAGGVQFQITYKGGVGSNDVVLTQLTASNVAQAGGITKLGNGSIQVGGTGAPGLSYTLQANDDLHTSNWVDIATSIADAQTGALSFIDPDAPKHPMRFYRFRGN
jgi:hypothetical protein